MAGEHRAREGEAHGNGRGGHTVKGSVGLLTLGALGVVYGDIGTSPLYAVRESFGEHHDIVATEANVSRQTIYRYFASREELLLEALLLELERAELDRSFAVPVDQIRTPADVGAIIVESVVQTIDCSR